MDSYVLKPKKPIRKTENARQRRRDIEKRIARLKEQDIDVLLGKRKHKTEDIYSDGSMEVDLPDETGEDSDDSLFVSNKTKISSLEDTTDSDSDSDGAVLTNSTSMGSETEETEEIIYRGRAPKKVPENPFCILPAGGKCITKPQDSWKYPGHSACYVFPIPYNNPFSYLAIHLRPSHRFQKGWAAVILGRAVKDVARDDEYYMGYLGFGKSSSFFKISAEPGTTCIVVYAIIRPESTVKEYIRDYEHGKKKTGPFLQLN